MAAGLTLPENFPLFAEAFDAEVRGNCAKKT
jgi:hypothetical protein